MREYKKFETHEEIDSTTASYILSVADADNIGEIALDDINSFLKGLNDYYEECVI